MSHRSGADILAKGIANAKLIVLPGARHSYFYTEPEKVHGMMREFLKEN
jgi:pimeloyl-ACP methyl ester carboxylesterase